MSANDNFEEPGRRLKPVTIKDVADHVGAAVSSVSRALNNHADVSDLMRGKVMKAAKDLNYQPDYLAQSLRRGATRSVGFLLRDLSNPIFADIVVGAEDRLSEDGYSLLLAHSGSGPAFSEDGIRLLQHRRVDGFLLSLESEQMTEALSAIADQNMPIVLVDREVPDLVASMVRCDHRTGVRRATEHLITLGHKRIGFLTGSRDIFASRDRYAGFRDALATIGREPEEELVRFDSYSSPRAHASTLELMGLTRPPTAIIASGVQSIAGVLGAMRQLGLRFAEDLSIVCCDEVQLLQYLDPPMSVVRRDARLMGRLAAELLLERLEGDAPVRTAVVPTEYIPRGSSTAPRK